MSRRLSCMKFIAKVHCYRRLFARKKKTTSHGEGKCRYLGAECSDNAARNVFSRNFVAPINRAWAHSLQKYSATNQEKWIHILKITSKRYLWKRKNKLATCWVAELSIWLSPECARWDYKFIWLFVRRRNAAESINKSVLSLSWGRVRISQIVKVATMKIKSTKRNRD